MSTNFPAPSNWILFSLAAATVAYHICLITPLRHIHRVPRTRLTPIWNGLIGVGMASLGASAVLLALMWIRAAAQITGLLISLQNFLALLSLASLADFLKVGPYITLVLGLTLTALGIGVLRWQNWARLGSVIFGLTLTFVTVAIAPFLLLMPELFPYQNLISFILIETLLFLATFLVRMLTQPETRLRYME